jgi:hypothetical protein
MREIGNWQVRRRLLHELPCFVPVLALDNSSVRPLCLGNRQDGFPRFMHIVEEDDAGRATGLQL